MNQPLVTVICNCYNHEKFVTEALLSVINQSYKNIELIVVNNGSIDDSLAKITTFLATNKNVKFINLTETLSHTKTFNLAFKQATGDYLIDLSGDDALLPHTVETQLRFFKTQDTALVFGNAFTIDDNGEILNTYFTTDYNKKVIDKALFNTNYQRLLNSGVVMCSASAMFTTKHFKLLNGFNEKLFFEDLDYWLRLSHQYKIVFIDEVIMKKRVVISSLGNQFFKKNSVAQKINSSLRIIYKEAIKRNTPKENKILLQRIHYSMDKSWQAKNFSELFKFTCLEVWCRLKCF